MLSLKRLCLTNNSVNWDYTASGGCEFNIPLTVWNKLSLTLEIWVLMDRRGRRKGVLLGLGSAMMGFVLFWEALGGKHNKPQAMLCAAFTALCSCHTGIMCRWSGWTLQCTCRRWCKLQVTSGSSSDVRGSKEACMSTANLANYLKLFSALFLLYFTLY